MTGFNEGVTYRPNDAVDNQGLNQLVHNVNYVYENLTPIRFSAYGNSARTSGLRIACGVVSIGPDESAMRVTRTVTFGSFFTVGAKPVVVATQATTDRVRSMTTIRGMSGGEIAPSHVGFHVSVSHQLGTTELTFARIQYVHYIAIGF